MSFVRGGQHEIWNLHGGQRNLHISDTQNVQMDREIRILCERWSIWICQVLKDAHSAVGQQVCLEQYLKEDGKTHITLG